MAQDAALQEVNPQPAEDDPGKSVRCNFDLSIGDDYSLLVHALTSEFLKFHEIRKPRIATLNQVETTLNCLLTNLINANQVAQLATFLFLCVEVIIPGTDTLNTA